jgi:hypothetical protein
LGQSTDFNSPAKIVTIGKTFQFRPFAGPQHFHFDVRFATALPKFIAGAPKPQKKAVPEPKIHPHKRRKFGSKLVEK